MGRVQFSCSLGGDVLCFLLLLPSLQLSEIGDQLILFAGEVRNQTVLTESEGRRKTQLPFHEGRESKGVGFIYKKIFFPVLHCCKTLIPLLLQIRARRSEKKEASESPYPLPSPQPAAASGLPSFVTLVTTPVPGDGEALGERGAAGGAQEMTAGGWGLGATSKAGKDQKQMEGPRRVGGSPFHTRPCRVHCYLGWEQWPCLLDGEDRWPVDQGALREGQLPASFKDLEIQTCRQQSQASGQTTAVAQTWTFLAAYTPFEFIQNTSANRELALAPVSPIAGGGWRAPLLAPKAQDHPPSSLSFSSHIQSITGCCQVHLLHIHGTREPSTPWPLPRAKPPCSLPWTTTTAAVPVSLGPFWPPSSLFFVYQPEGLLTT